MQDQIKSRIEELKQSLAAKQQQLGQVQAAQERLTAEINGHIGAINELERLVRVGEPDKQEGQDQCPENQKTEPAKK